MRSRICGSSILAVILAMTSHAFSTSFLSIPASHVALSGDLTVNYSINSTELTSDGVIECIYLDTNEVVATQTISKDVNIFQILVPCDLINQVGKYLIKLRDDAKVLDSEFVDVRWPEIILEAPPHHEALSLDVVLTISIKNAVCAMPEIPAWIELIYLGKNDTKKPGQHVAQELVQGFQNNVIKLTFSCRMFDLEGIYQFLYKLNNNETSLISNSEYVNVTRGNQYIINDYASSIFPCSGNIMVYYDYPPCIGEEDKIRLFAQKQLNVSSLATLRNLEYVFERRVQKGKNSAVFNCDIFQKTIPGYCFKYISTARNGAVREIEQQCIPTKPITEPIVHGRWTDWSAWSECTITCGQGIRNRYRTCDNPPPTNGGHFCEGKAITTSMCKLRECPGIMSTISPVDISHLSPECRCGCQLNISHHIISSSNKFCTGLNIWTVEVPRGLRIHVLFVFLDLRNDVEWVKVRNGDSKNAELLIYHSGHHLPNPVISSNNKIRVEFQSIATTTEPAGKGFALKYAAVESQWNPSKYNRILPNRLVKESFWESTVGIVVVSLVGIAILVSLSFAIHHQVFRKRKYHIKKLSTSRGSSPGDSHGKYQPFHPVAISSFSDSCSYGFHKLGSQKEMYKIQDFSSHESESGAVYYASLASPYYANASPEDYLHDAKLFSATPVSIDDNSHSPAKSPIPKNNDNELVIAEKLLSDDGAHAKRKQLHLPLKPCHEGNYVPPLKKNRHKTKAVVIETKAEVLPPPRSHKSRHRRRIHGTKEKETSFLPNIPEDTIQKEKVLAENKAEENQGAIPKSSSEDRLSKTVKRLSTSSKDSRSSKGSRSSDKKNYNDPDTKVKESKKSKPLSPRIVDRPLLKSEFIPLHKIIKKVVETPAMSTGTPSEVMSVADDFEYDDYIPNVPGSFFDIDANMLGWPPFIPHPPGMYPLQMRQSPSLNEEAIDFPIIDSNLSQATEKDIPFVEDDAQSFNEPEITYRKDTKSYYELQAPYTPETQSLKGSQIIPINLSSDHITGDVNGNDENAN